jgi:glycosyltransferase involved in cell wall biosynthesis
MKTLFISYNGALEPLIQSQGIPYLKGLSEKGVKCFLLTFEKNDKKYARDKIQKLKDELKEHDIKWYRLRYHKKPSLPATLFDVFMGILAGAWIVFFKKVDIIHCRSTVPAAMGYVISRFLPGKFIFDERGLMAEEYVDGGMWKRDSLVYRVTLYFEKKFLERSDAVIVLSNKIRDFFISTDYLKNIKDKKTHITVIPTCVDLNKFVYSGKKRAYIREKFAIEDKFVFLYIGTLGTWYLIDEMLDFFKRAKDIIPNAHFLFLLNTDKDAVTRLIAEKRISPEDITITNAEPSEVPRYISAADAGMFFIKPCFSKQSSCPTKFAEYLACGLPVVINRGVGDTAEMVEENKIGIVVDDFKDENYDRAINDFLQVSSRDNDALNKRCRETAERLFAVEKGSQLYFDVYSRIIRHPEESLF